MEECFQFQTNHKILLILLVNTIKNNNVEIKEETVVNDISKNDQSFIVKHKMANLNQKQLLLRLVEQASPNWIHR